MNAAEILAREKEGIEKYGFFVYCVPEADPMVYNCHTRGLKEKFNHCDLQIYIKLSPQLMMSIFHNIVDRIKAGEKFKHNDIVPNVIGNYSVRLVNAKEDDRNILRIIVPDRDGCLMPNEIDKFHARQYQGVTNG